MFGGIGDNDRKNFILAAILIGVTLGIYLIFRYVLFLVAPFLIGLIIAAFIKKPVYFLKRKFRINPIIGAILVILTVLGAIIFFLTYVGGRFVYEFKILMLNYDFYYNSIMDSICDICCQIDTAFNFVDGRTYTMVEKGLNNTISTAASNILPVVVEKSVSIIIKIFVLGGGILIAFTAVLFIIKDMEKMTLWINEGQYSKWFRIFFGRLTHFGIAYIKTQFIIMSITACTCTIIMLLIGNRYPVMIGILLGLLDALPLFGTGAILIPWTIIALISGNYLKAAIIFTGYCICYIVREFFEPKLMGGQMGIKPLTMLIAMYVGVLLFGISGFVVGPAAYIMVCEIMKYVAKVI